MLQYRIIWWFISVDIKNISLSLWSTPTPAKISKWIKIRRSRLFWKETFGNNYAWVRFTIETNVSLQHVSEYVNCTETWQNCKDSTATPEEGPIMLEKLCCDFLHVCQWHWYIRMSKPWLVKLALSTKQLNLLTHISPSYPSKRWIGTFEV